MIYHGDEYQYNLIDTPGHVDFNYEVSRSLSATDGVLLLVDATKGVQAQTVANYRLAKEANLVIIPIVNKIDTAAAEVEATINQLGDLDDAFTPENIIKISAKSGLNVEAVLTAIRDRIPAPAGDEKSALQALVFDSKFDPYKGIIVQARLVQGTLNNNDQVLFMANEIKSGIKEMGVFAPLMTPVKQLRAGDVGFIVTVKDQAAWRYITLLNNLLRPPPGYQDVNHGLCRPLSSRHILDEVRGMKLAKRCCFQYETEQSEALVWDFVVAS